MMLATELTITARKNDSCIRSECRF